MQKQLALLWELQCLDQQRAILQRQCAALHEAATKTAAREMMALERDIDGGRQRLSKCRQQYARLEQLYREDMARYRELEKRLYSAAVKSKELAPMQERCNAAKAAVTQREETLLQLLAQLETLEGEIKSQTAQLTARQAVVATKRELAERDEVMKRRELTKLEEQSAALVARIDVALVQWYRRMCQSLPNPVARVRAGTCGGCCVVLPQRQLAGPHREISYCENCGRALLFPE